MSTVAVALAVLIQLAKPSASVIENHGVMHSHLLSIASKADFVLIGQCTSQRSEWNDRRMLIHTYLTYDVQERIKGTLPGQVVVRVLGGTVGNITQVAVGLPRSQPGDRDLLFLSTSDQAEVLQHKNLRFASLHVRTEASTGEMYILAPESPDHAAALGQPALTCANAASRQTRVPVSQLLTLFRRLEQVVPEDGPK